MVWLNQIFIVLLIRLDMQNIWPGTARTDERITPGNPAPNILCFSRNCKYFYLRRTAETEERSDTQVMLYVVWR